jgi:hypothetical protein
MTDIQRVGYDHSMHDRGMDKAADRFVQDKEERLSAGSAEDNHRQG